MKIENLINRIKNKSISDDLKAAEFQSLAMRQRAGSIAQKMCKDAMEEYGGYEAMYRAFKPFLKEQMYTNTNKVYYHGGPDKINDKYLRSKGRDLIYLSNSEEYAIQYALKNNPTDGVITGYLYEIKLTEPLNIFNAKCRTDSKKLYDYIMNLFNNDEDFSDDKKNFEYNLGYLLTQLEDKDWVDVVFGTEFTRHELFNYIKDMGYDGFFNFEKHREGEGPAIGLFIQHQADGRAKTSLPHKSTKILRYKKITSKLGKIEYGPWKDISMTYNQKRKLGYLVESFNKLHLIEKIDDELNKWLTIYSRTDPYSKENVEAIKMIKLLRSQKQDLVDDNIEISKKRLIGNCREVGVREDLPWEDATELSNDFGYYSTFEEDDGDPEDSNYEQISAKEFREKCNWSDIDKYGDEENFIFLKRYDDSIYCAYHLEDDIHYFFE